jgi:hypothetical protein
MASGIQLDGCTSRGREQIRALSTRNPVRPMPSRGPARRASAPSGLVVGEAVGMPHRRETSPPRTRPTCMGTLAHTARHAMAVTSQGRQWVGHARPTAMHIRANRRSRRTVSSATQSVTSLNGAPIEACRAMLSYRVGRTGSATCARQIPSAQLGHCMPSVGYASRRGEVAVVRTIVLFARSNTTFLAMMLVARVTARYDSALPRYSAS